MLRISTDKFITLAQIFMSLVLTIAEVSPATWSAWISDKPLIVGRDEAADVRFEHRSVSRQHCRFWQEDEAYFVEDCGSTNGTFVNGKRAVGKTAIDSGDRIVVGHFDLLALSDREMLETVTDAQQATAPVDFCDPIAEERHLALVAHARLTPSRSMSLPGMLLEVSYAPSGVLGGDCFECVDLGDKWVFAMFDAMTHGTKSALGISLLRNELQRWVKLTSQPAQCLQWINDEIVSLGVQELVVAACQAVWFPKSQLLVYSTAGTHAPVLVRDGGNVEATVSADGLPLGVQRGEEYVEHLIEMKRGDRLFLFSDGVRRLVDPQSRETTVDADFIGKLLHEINAGLFDKVRRMLGDPAVELEDDVLLVGCEVED